MHFLVEYSGFKGEVYATEPTVRFAELTMMELVSYTVKNITLPSDIPATPVGAAFECGRIKGDGTLGKKRSSGTFAVQWSAAGSVQLTGSRMRDLPSFITFTRHKADQATAPPAKKAARVTALNL